MKKIEFYSFNNFLALSLGDVWQIVITANLKTSGGGCWNFLALWGALAKREEMLPKLKHS